MRRKADNAADFPRSAATTHTPFFLRISPYGGFLHLSVISQVPQNPIIHSHENSKKLNRNIARAITINIAILFPAKS